MWKVLCKLLICMIKLFVHYSNVRITHRTDAPPLAPDEIDHWTCPEYLTKSTTILVSSKIVGDASELESEHVVMQLVESYIVILTSRTGHIWVNVTCRNVRNGKILRRVFQE